MKCGPTPSPVGDIESDTVVSPASYDVALMAAGATCDALERLVRGEDRQALCHSAPRPSRGDQPRHGFCLFNNVAVAPSWQLTSWDSIGS